MLQTNAKHQYIVDHSGDVGYKEAMILNAGVNAFAFVGRYSPVQSGEPMSNF